MEQWKVELIKGKMELAKRQSFSLEVDLRVSRKVGDKELEDRVVADMKRVESILLALEEELNGQS